MRILGVFLVVGGTVFAYALALGLWLGVLIWLVLEGGGALWGMIWLIVGLGIGIALTVPLRVVGVWLPLVRGRND
jgi:hypothetical protein